MIKFKNKELKEWWNPNFENDFRGIHLAKEYFGREDYHNISEEEIAEIKRKEEDPNRKKLIPIANEMIEDRSWDFYYTIGVDISNYAYKKKYLINQLLDFYEIVTKTKE